MAGTDFRIRAMSLRNLLLLGLCVGAFGCAREPEAPVVGAAASGAAPAAAAAAFPLQSGAWPGLPAGGRVATSGAGGAQAPLSFASLPDRGELLAYHRDTVRQEGAYTWYRSDFSEAHALAAIASGHLRVNTPDGKLLDFQYDRHVEHPSGDWTWIGHLPGMPGVQAVLTFGAQAAFGNIGQPNALPLRMTVRDGHGWLVATDAAKLAKVIGDVTAQQDFLLPPPPAVDPAGPRVAAAQALVPVASANPTIDLLVGYTTGFASAQGGQSGAMTRLNNLADYTNQAYVNSGLPGRIRLVGAIQVSYPDTATNNDTLHKLSGYDSEAQKAIPPDPAFAALRAARDTYGADLVSLVRPFRSPEHGSCGVAWLLGGGKQGTVQGAGGFGYSVVSDGSDRNESDGRNYYCETHTLAHELGHNMGLAHDRKTAEGDDGKLDDPGDYGVFAYSFGYKTAAFYTIMAYGSNALTSYNVFSNPRTNLCGSPCGIAAGQANAADASLSLSQTMPQVANFRQTVVYFSDVAPDYWAYDAIRRITRAGITAGCGANDPYAPAFCPEEPVSRDQMAIFLLKGMHGGSYTPPAVTSSRYQDVPSNFWALPWIEQLTNEGATSGCSVSPPYYCPAQAVSRGQMAVFLLRAKYGPSYVPPRAIGRFQDVPTSYWAADWIEKLATDGISSGCSTAPPAFCPESVVSRAQMAVFLAKTFGL